MATKRKPLTGTKNGSGVWQRIVSEIPPHRVRIEAFWGRGSISRRMRPAEILIGIDLDPDAIADGGDVAMMWQANCLDWLENYFQLSPDPVTPKTASLPAATRKAAASADDAENRSGRPTLKNASAAADAALSVPAATRKAAAGVATFGGAGHHQHFVYLDPPYYLVRNYYKTPFAAADHVRLLNIFLALPCPAALSGYWTDLYRERLAGVRSIEIPTSNRAGKKCVEVLWLNYPPPLVVHDPRFFGNGRRERQRIARRGKTWSDGLDRMTPIERQFVFEQMTARYHDAQNGDGIP